MQDLDVDVTVCGIDLKSSDIALLGGTAFLNDAIVDAGLALLVEESYSRSYMSWNSFLLLVLTSWFHDKSDKQVHIFKLVIIISVAKH